ncbi:hypothetical protein LSCM1_05667 [Leishmania martiniquensis]|uniref:FHA domain-containing protein n=1 Tax=Leishmania martiniquensis TaxID=1580590 RepID=A0A836KTA1_9TRYP|nr:hypothetical protein LSCM1_05667 [Leishmania martiniquensis]
MYILEVNYGDGEIHRHFLLPDQTYTLGRKQCRILLPASEPSISRHHATIFVSPMPRYSILDPSAQLEVRIEDASKHGTFVDRERIGRYNSRFLYPEDRIRLGLRITARIIPVVLVLAISPALTDESWDLVVDACVGMGALVVEETIPAPLRYYEQHTNCIGFLYVAEDCFRMDETMMAALGYGYTLVTPHYVASLARSLEKKDTLMPGEFPSPSSPLPASLALRSVHYRRPAQTFFSVTEFLSTGRPAAATVFCGCTFVLLVGTLEETYNEVLRLGGGTVEAVAPNAVAAWLSRQPSPPPLPRTTIVLVGDGDFRRVADEVIERGGGRGVFQAKHASPAICGYLTMYKYGVCLIPEENVHLALYRNDAKELNAKATSRYLQRTTDDMLADTTQSPVEDAPWGMSSGIVTDVSSMSHRGSTIRVSESPTNTSPLSVAPLDPAPSVLQRSREAFSGASTSFSGADKKVSATATADTTNTAVLTAAKADSTHVIRSQTGSRPTSPNLISSLHSSRSDRSLSASSQPSSAAPATSPRSGLSCPSPDTVALAIAPAAAAPPPAPSDGTCRTADTVASELLPIAALETTTASSSACTGGGDRSAAERCEDKPADTSSAAMATTVQGTMSASQRTSSHTTRRNSHPFSLSARARNRGEGSDEEEESTKKSTGGATEPEDAEGLQGRRCSRFSSGRRASGGLLRSNRGHSPAATSLKSEGLVRTRSRAALGPHPSETAATGSPRAHRPPRTVEERRPLKSQTISEESWCDSALEGWRGRRVAGATESAAANGAMPPLPPSTSTSPAASASTTTITATAPVLHRTAQPKSAAAQAVPAVAALAGEAAQPKPRYRERTTDGATGKDSEAPHQVPSIRRGEQCLASSAALSPRYGFVRVSSYVDPVHREGHHGGEQLTSSLHSAHNEGERRTTPERDVLVHTASQVSVSSARQRVEAVRVGSVLERCTSFSRDFEHSLSRYAESAENDAEKAGSRRSAVRREPVSCATRLPPSKGAGPLITRLASFPFERSESSRMREMATPHRLVTPRASSNMSRNRSSQASTSAQRYRSPVATDEECTPRLNIGDAAEGRSGTASARRCSTRRRGGSPTHGNGKVSVSSLNLSAPGQILGCRSGHAVSARGTTSSGTTESFSRINKELCSHCQSFMKIFLNNFVSDTERTTRHVARQAFMDSESKQMLEEGAERLLECLNYISAVEPDIPAMYSTSSTRAACRQVRQKSQYALSKMKACYRALSCKVPGVVTRAQAALSTRTMLPRHQKRSSSVTAGAQGGQSQRTCAF